MGMLHDIRTTTALGRGHDSPFYGRLIEAMRASTADGNLPDHIVAALPEIPETDLSRLGKLVAEAVPGRFSLTGGLDRRVLFAERPVALGGWVVADLSGQPHCTREWPSWTAGRVTVAEPERWLSTADLAGDAPERLARPRILLTSLYHPEWFPLPRFPLAISDLARAARLTLMGQVQLIDMQLGASLDDITRWVQDQRPDIVGISATFGQHDLMIELLDQLMQMSAPPLVLAGGSLTVRNEGMLLDKYPELLIARGAGEPTIADAIAHYHGDCDLPAVRGLGYRGAPRGGALAIGTTPRRTAVQPNRLRAEHRAVAPSRSAPRHGAQPCNRTGSGTTSCPNWTCWTPHSRTTVWRNWRSPADAPAIARSVPVGTKAPGPAATPPACRGCWPRSARSPTGTRRSRAPFTWSTRSSSAAARTPSTGP
ncbi:hypothetical protein [Amycolatopsis plumensis]|uniref:B12-binding domain-containing protein n=1 Tax=Amycolatopsis plumensis TaxID=236508 RepID=A0ABV5U3Y2_9PSEU